MERGWSVLQPASKRLTQTHSTEPGPDLDGAPGEACPHLLPAATSLCSPDVSSKMASDLLIRLSEATQKAQVHAGSRAENGPQRQEAGGQQDEPGLALSPDGPGASPEPPTLSHTPDSSAPTDTLASELLRRLAERQENSLSVRIKEEEEPMEVDSLAIFDLSKNRPITEQLSLLPPTTLDRHLLNIKTEEGGGAGPEPLQTKTSERCLLGLRADRLFGSQKTFELKVKEEPRADGDEPLLFKVSQLPLTGAQGRGGPSGPGPGSPLLFKTEEPLFFGAKAEDQFGSGAKMADQCLRAVLWQDMSVNLASALLHQLSERVSKSSSQMTDRTPVRNSPPPGLSVDQSGSTLPLGPTEPAAETSLREQTPGGTYFYRCHVCGFETGARGLFFSHMTEHRPWERRLFSLHCCSCDLSTNQEPEMTAHLDTHLGLRCPPPPAAVAVETPLEPSAHRCRICQRSFPGQQELLVHFQGHRHGNQYRCERCGHLTRTANKLVEHVRVHTGERPFTCTLCPYSAKRRDSLRLHCKVKHPAHVHAPAHVRAPAQVHRDTQRLLTPPSLPLPPLWDQPKWRELSPLLPITTLLNIRPRPPEPQPHKPLPPGQYDQSGPSCPPTSAASSFKQSYMSYLGLASSL